MNWKTLMVSVTLSTSLLSACGTDNNNVNDTAMRNQDNNNLRNVNYNPNQYNNNADHNANYNVTHNADRNGLNNTNRNYDHNNVNRNVTNVNNNNNRLDVADKAAEKIVSMREVDQANVIVTNNNAYVAAKLTNNTGDRLDKKVEKKISDVVKSTDPNIDHVYVSSNPDFYTRTTSYANDIRNGRPVAGFFDEFNTLVRRVFPTQR
jgi:spore cortex protein